MFKTENHCKTPQVVDATDGTRHTRKRGLRTLKRTLSLRALKKTLLSRKIEDKYLAEKFHADLLISGEHFRIDRHSLIASFSI